MGYAIALVLLSAPPAGDEALKVITHYYEGAPEGPVLMKSFPCRKIDSVADSKTKNECIEPVGDAPVAVNETIRLWTMWLVPLGGSYDDVAVQISHEGVVRETKDLKLTESIRMRTWSSAKLTKPGKWTFKILRGQNELATHDVVVRE